MSSSVSDITMVFRKMADVQYMKSVLIKYFLEAALLTFAFYWVVYKSKTNRIAPSPENVLRIFTWIIVLYTAMDILAPQAISYVRAGIGFSLGTHLAGGVQMMKLA